MLKATPAPTLSRIAHVLTRDERSASYMADGYSRASGGAAVCEGPSGGGATCMLPGVAEAKSWRVADPADLPPPPRAAARHHGPALVDVITQPLHLARAPVSERVV